MLKFQPILTKDPKDPIKYIIKINKNIDIWVIGNPYVYRVLYTPIGSFRVTWLKPLKFQRILRPDGFGSFTIQLYET